MKPNNIKLRLAALGKTQRDLLRELGKDEIVSASQLSLYLSGIDHSPKACRIISKSKSILDKWENEDTNKRK